MNALNDQHCRVIIDNLHDGVYFVDTNRVILYWNKAAERITGFRADEVVGKSCADDVLTHIDEDGTSLCKGLCPLAASMQDGQGREAKVFLHHKQGHRVPVSVRVNTLLDSDGNIAGGVELFTDLSNQEANDLRVKELERMALLDNLTQLANRNFIEKELKIRFEEKRRYNIPFGVLFIDIDHFKKFNDTWGHDVGDEVLKFVANTLVASSRPFDVFGRWGGEEFIGIIRNISFENLESMANRVRELIASSYLIQAEQKLQVTVSIGATMVVEGDAVERVLKRADDLLYASKHNGRNCVTVG